MTRLPSSVHTCAGGWSCLHPQLPPQTNTGRLHSSNTGTTVGSRQRTGARLGQAGRPMDDVGGGKRADLGAHLRRGMRQAAESDVSWTKLPLRR